MATFAITGVMGSGKSTVVNHLVSLGLVAISADEITRDLQRTGTPVFDQIVNKWGQTILTKTGELDRSALASIVFNSESDLEFLENIIHPSVYLEIRQRLSVIGNNQIVGLELPLLKHDDKYLELLDGVVLVESDIDIAINRLIEDRGYSPDAVSTRIQNQIDNPTRTSEADFKITNNATLDELFSQVETCWQWMLDLND